jgi:tetratricopeptide (TPR) repeat protein
MRALGETYQTVEKNDQAIEAYAALLEMYPLYEEAPLIKQNIAQTYYNLGRDDDEYRTRYELFQNYNPGSEWYAHVVNSEIPDRLKYEQDAYKLSERAIYTNIALDLERAQELEEENQPSRATYEVVAQGCQEYLQVFASDSNSYNINWYYALILDEHLGRFDEAYEQYILVSNDYLETEHQEEAANNAIFVADTLVMIAIGAERDTTGLIDLTDQESLRPEVMSVEEKRLVEAYDNYIRLFPEGENTPVYLAAAGGLYFNHKQFAEARTYFKTLVTRFPGAKEKNIAMRSIMESYFALGQFKDSEFIAKRILQSPDLPEEQKVFAAKRLASSIFNNAKLFEDQGQFLEAATEYRRVFEETPDDTTYAEAALFNSGQNYDKVKEWQSALETYTMLAETYPESKYALSALGNAAEDYKELKQFGDAGAMYERIYALNESDPEQAEVALYNASYYFKLGEDWTNTIRINNKYITTYPGNDIAKDLYFDNAGHYLKLDNLTEANRIFEEFTARYPDDARGVEAFYQRGSYFQEHQQLSAAKVEFNKAIQKSEQLNSQGLDPNRYYVGEALNSLSGMLYDEYESIELRQPASNISSQQNRLKTLITEVLNTNQKIVANGSIRSFEAVYKNAEVYEKFADKYSNQERPQNIDKNQKFAEDKRINEESAALYDKAVEEYKNAMSNIPQIAEKFGVDIFAEDTVAIAEVEVDTMYADTSFVVSRAEKVDSTKEVATKWYELATGKISYLYYKEANITKANIDEALNMENPYAGDPLRGLIYSVQLISTVINPAVQQTIKAHQRNIQEAEQLGLSNKYTEESKRQILLTSNIPAKELEELVFEILRTYSQKITEYKRLVELEYGTTNEKGEDYVLIADNVKQMVDYSKALAISTMDNYTSTLKMAQEENISSDLIRTTETRMLRLAVELTDIYQVYHDSAVVNDSLYTRKFAETENYNLDDASLFFQDLAFNFNDYEREILDHGFQLKEEYAIKNLWANILLAKLIQIDPATYAGNIEREKHLITSDDTWVYSTQYSQGYNRYDFDDSSWQQTGIVPTAYNQFMDLGFDPLSMWVRRVQSMPDTSVIDSLQMSLIDSSAGLDTLMSQDTTGQVDGAQDMAVFASDTAVIDTVYFRKKINLQGTPVEGIIYLTADNDYIFFLNEEYIIDDEANNFAIIDTLDFSYVSYYIKPGDNILAIRAVDTDISGGGVKIYGYLELLPLDLTAAVREQSEVKKLDVDPMILKKLNTLNKNRITINQ